MASAVTPCAVAPPLPLVASYCLQGGMAIETPAWRPSARQAKLPCWAGTTDGTVAGPVGALVPVEPEPPVEPVLPVAPAWPAWPPPDAVAPVLPVADASPGLAAVACSDPPAVTPAGWPDVLTFELLLVLPGNSVTSSTRARTSATAGP